MPLSSGLQNLGYQGRGHKEIRARRRKASISDLTEVMQPVDQNAKNSAYVQAGISDRPHHFRRSPAPG